MKLSVFENEHTCVVSCGVMFFLFVLLLRSQMVETVYVPCNSN